MPELALSAGWRQERASPWGERTCAASVRALALGDLGDQPGTTLEGQIVPEPGEGDDETVTQADQEVDVRQAPEQPAHEAFQFERAKLHDCGAATDRRQFAKMHVPKWLLPLAARDARGDQLADIFPHLLCGGRDSRHRLPLAIGSCGRIADDEHFRMAG